MHSWLCWARSMLRGATKEAHSQTCATRMEEHLKNSIRYKEPQKREYELLERTLEVDDERKKKLRTDGPGNSWISGSSADGTIEASAESSGARVRRERLRAGAVAHAPPPMATKRNRDPEDEGVGEGSGCIVRSIYALEMLDQRRGR